MSVKLGPLLREYPANPNTIYKTSSLDELLTVLENYAKDVGGLFAKLPLDSELEQITKGHLFDILNLMDDIEEAKDVSTYYEETGNLNSALDRANEIKFTPTICMGLVDSIRSNTIITPDSLKPINYNDLYNRWKLKSLSSTKSPQYKSFRSKPMPQLDKVELDTSILNKI